MVQKAMPFSVFGAFAGRRMPVVPKRSPAVSLPELGFLCPIVGRFQQNISVDCRKQSAHTEERGVTADQPRSLTSVGGVKLNPTKVQPVRRGPTMANNSKDKRTPLTAVEVREAFEPLQNEYPPILNLQAAAKLSGYSPLTLRKKLSEGWFGSSAKRGKPVLFWRDRFVIELMDRPMAVRRNSPINGGDHETH